MTDEEFTQLQGNVATAAEQAHGRTCIKVPHIKSDGGYLHAPDDDGPFDVDNVWYCGRCHAAIPEPKVKFSTHVAEDGSASHMQREALERLPERRNKYGVAPKEERTVDGILFASKAEMEAYCKLRMLQAAGEVTKLELQPVFKFPPGFEYRADFRVTYRDGSVSVVDTKGVETAVFRLKKRCLEYFYPDVKLEIWR